MSNVDQKMKHHKNDRNTKGNVSRNRRAIRDMKRNSKLK